MNYEIQQELLSLARNNNYLLPDNNRMLKEIIAYINFKESQADKENNDDFFRNILANLISTNLELNSFVK